jgi:hypothetical protein
VRVLGRLPSGRWGLTADWPAPCFCALACLNKPKSSSHTTTGIAEWSSCMPPPSRMPVYFCLVFCFQDLCLH